MPNRIANTACDKKEMVFNELNQSPENRGLSQRAATGKNKRPTRAFFFIAIETAQPLAPRANRVI